jgi:hypothetical protein
MVQIIVTEDVLIPEILDIVEVLEKHEIIEFKGMGATAKVDFLLVVEKVGGS